MSGKIPYVVSVRINNSLLTEFKNKCREGKLTQSSVIEGFIAAWLEGEYVITDDSVEIRRKFAAMVHSQGKEPSKILDSLMRAVIDEEIFIEDIV